MRAFSRLATPFHRLAAPVGHRVQTQALDRYVAAVRRAAGR